MGKVNIKKNLESFIHFPYQYEFEKSHKNNKKIKLNTEETLNQNQNKISENLFQKGINADVKQQKHLSKKKNLDFPQVLDEKIVPTNFFGNKHEDDTNQRFFLRKRKHVNYNLEKNEIEFYDNSFDSSSFKEKLTKSQKNKKSLKSKIKKEKKKNNMGLSYDSIQCKQKKTRFDEEPSPEECRFNQLSSLLNWKKEVSNLQTKEGEYKYFELENIVEEDLNQFGDDIQALLISPPWTDSSEIPFNFDEFKKLKLPLKKMKEGLIFIWCEKQMIADIITFMEEKGLKYVENLVWVKLDTNLKKKKSDSVEKFDLENIFHKKENEYFSNSHMTLLIFRKFLPDNKRNLELRHQRSGDVVFDHINSDDYRYKPNLYLYKLIETLLPKALYKEKENLKMMEIFSRSGEFRKGWIHLVQK